ncbi:MAG: glycosyltransferase [Eudoraea sp.]|nr:glycosyltransferase [Eudoraea sp.]
MKKLTLVICALNEGDEPKKTIASIYEHTPMDEVDIILFDDGSEEKIELPRKYKDVKLIRHGQRMGIPYCRDNGVELAETKYVGILNARMRFTPGWYEKVIKHLEAEPKTLFCTTSVVLWDMDAKQMREYAKSLPVDSDKQKAEDHAKRLEGMKNVDEIDEDKERKYGADLIGWHEDSKTLMQVNWRKPEDKDCYEIPCVLGANYFTTRKWWKHIKGEHGLIDYGSCEEFISLKTWAFGGKVKIIKDVEIGNIYRQFKTYSDNLDHTIWNKLFVAFTLLPWKKAYGYMHKIKQVPKFAKNYQTYRDMLIRRMPYIIERRKEFEKLTVNNVEHLIIDKNGSKRR